MKDPICYWTIDGVPACQSPHIFGLDFDPPNWCADTRFELEKLVVRFHSLRPGHDVQIVDGHCTSDAGYHRHEEWNGDNQ